MSKLTWPWLVTPMRGVLLSIPCRPTAGELGVQQQQQGSHRSYSVNTLGDRGKNPQAAMPAAGTEVRPPLAQTQQCLGSLFDLKVPQACVGCAGPCRAGCMLHAGPTKTRLVLRTRRACIHAHASAHMLWQLCGLPYRLREHLPLPPKVVARLE